MPIRILIADDHAMFRAGLKSLIEQTSDMLVVGEFGSGSEALSAIRTSEVDVLLLDLSMPGMHGARVVETALKEKPKLLIIIVTMHEDEQYMRELFAMGVRSYVLKQSRPQELLEAIRKVTRGEPYVDSHLSSSAVGWFADRSARGVARVERLTKREQSVCALLALGHTNAEISERLHLSARTVENHRAAIMAKLGLKSRAELVRYAIEAGLLRTS